MAPDQTHSSNITIPERFCISTGDGFGRGSNWSRSSSHRYGTGGKQASPGSAKPLRWNISSGTLYFSNSGKLNRKKMSLQTKLYMFSS